jgi:hypothetical protein
MRYDDEDYVSDVWNRFEECTRKLLDACYEHEFRQIHGTVIHTYEWSCRSNDKAMQHYAQNYKNLCYQEDFLPPAFKVLLSKLEIFWDTFIVLWRILKE